MQVTVNKSLQLDTPVQNVWTLFRDVDRFARLIPGVSDIQVEKEGDQEKYIARLADKVGPFKIEMTVEIKLVQMVTNQLLEAQLTGFDGGGKNRMKGHLQAELSQLENDKTQVEFTANIEVLGRLASLGASPIRRRTDQHFSEFARRIEQQFSSE